MTQEPRSVSASTIESFRRNIVGEERLIPLEAAVMMSVRASSIADALVRDPRLLADVWGRIGEKLNSRKAKEIAVMMPEFVGERPIKILLELLDHLRVSVRLAGIDPDSPT